MKSIKARELVDRFNISSSNYNPVEKHIDFTIQLPTNDTREIMIYLANKANIKHFSETVPSANEIFIRTVKNKGFHE